MGRIRALGAGVVRCGSVGGLSPHQEMSPGLEDKLAFTVTATGSYEEAALVAQKWNCPVDDSTLHALTRRLGTRAEQQTQERLQSVARELTPLRADSQLAVFMLDGYLVRYRGPGWGKKKTKNKRVEWHERRLHWEAQRRGLGRAQWVLVLGDGAAWIWNVAADRWAGAQELLDFYHASEHLWALGRALYPEEEVQEWVEGRLHELRHGEEEKFLARIKRLKPRRGEVGKTIREQKNYFANQAQRINYEEIAQRGWPIGSGAVESACGGKQGRFKRRGQFWTQAGVSHLEALMEARENHHWDELWFAA
jgi:hypothetical protein